jgi:hypothetical protein
MGAAEVTQFLRSERIRGPFSHSSVADRIRQGKKCRPGDSGRPPAPNAVAPP